MGSVTNEKMETVAVPRVIGYNTIFDEWKWDHFVRDHGLERASLDQYYLGKNLDSVVTLSDCKRLLANLFSDAVSSGAVFLPSPYTYDDFTFEKVERHRGVAQGVDVRIVLKSWTVIRGYGNSNKMFSDTLSSETAKDCARRIAEDANLSLSHVFPVMFEYANGAKAWYLNGVHHREDGPAIEFADGDKQWWVNGKQHRLVGPAVERVTGFKAWYLNGVRHCDDGPAVERVDGRREWWVDGVMIREESPPTAYFFTSQLV